MNTLSFINSEDIRNHLEKINYKFNPLETAYLIYNSNHMTYNEKKEKWLKLIETMPDCEVPEYNRFCPHRDSLHRMIKDYMEGMDEILKEFYSEKEDYVYQFELFGDKYSYKRRQIYPSLEKCLKDVHIHIETNVNYVGYRVLKQSLSGNTIALKFNKNDEFLIDGICYQLNNIDKFDVLDSSFNGFVIKIPVPFKKGDIVCVPNGKYNYSSGIGIPFVIEKEEFPDEELYMNVTGVFGPDEDCPWYIPESGLNYLDLEYYHGDFKNSEKILPKVSEYLKGEIDIGKLVTEMDRHNGIF